jgi:tRNA 2-selenouridine synthase
MSIPYFEAADYLKHKKPAGLLLDVRSPSEYTSGHFPGAINLPLLQDEERKEVGIAYKHKGYEAAFDLGLSFVGPKMTGFVQFVRRYKSPLPITLYCWRGGKRSASMAWLLQNAGLEVQVISGGYNRSESNCCWKLKKRGFYILFPDTQAPVKRSYYIGLKQKENRW